MGEYEPTKTQQIIVESGDFVFSGLNIEKGAAGFNETGGRLVVSANYSTCSYNDGKVSLDFFKHYMRSENFQRLLKANLKKDYGFTRPKHLMPLTFLVPADKAEQHRIVGEYEACKVTHSEFSTEIARQQTLLAKLKQAILQEAIQGKLTADWRAANPDVEPASQLLHRIQAEKALLIAAKKLRPEKPLPKITPEEIPFAIPKTWEWCRFGSYAHFQRGKFSPRPRNDKRFFDGPYPFIQIGSLDKHGSLITSSNQTLNEAGLAVSKLFKKGTILIAIVGGTIGNLGVLGRDMCCTDSLIGVQPNALTCQDFNLLMLRCKQPQIQSAAYQRSGQPNISLPNLTEILIPLPPLPEQAEIVARVEVLMTTCRLLEVEIEHARTHVAHLLQAVLKEAFGPAKSTPDETALDLPNGTLASAADTQSVSTPSQRKVRRRVKAN